MLLLCSWIKCHTICFIKNTLIVQVRYITIETKEVTRIGYNGLPFPHEYSDEGRGAYIIYDNSSIIHLTDLFIIC
jgi:hypothetical protein